MDKIVKIFFLILLSINFGLSQEWQSISHQNYDCPCPFISSINTVNKHFKINPYDNSLWLSRNDEIYTISNNGIYESFINTPLASFNLSDPFLDFAFTQNAVFATKSAMGLFKYENNEWQYLIQNYGAWHISSDVDTIWITDTGDNFYSWHSNASHEGSQIFRRTVHKNGQFWKASDESSTSKFENGISTFYAPDTCLLLDISNYDFKFSRNTDSLYVAGKLGLSIAHGNAFIDSIDTNSSINMPSSSIYEFEFDQHDNIWAVFAILPISSQDFIPSYIGYYEQASRTWTKYYDSLNSPVDFTQKFTIEVDTAGNLWVAQGNYLHVLKINNAPQWLNTLEIENKFNFSLAPNPTSDFLNLNFEKNLENLSFKLISLSGQIVFQESHLSGKVITIDLSSQAKGMYLLEVEIEGQKEVMKVIKE